MDRIVTDMLEAGILNNDIPMPKEWTRLIEVRKYIVFLYQEIGAVIRKIISQSEH